MKTKILTATILALFLLALMFPSLKADNKEGCIRYFGWGSDPDGSAHCMSEEAALPSNMGGVEPQGPLTVTAGQPVTFAINWSEWHGGSNVWTIYIGTISGTISYPPYNVSYPQLVGTTLLASWRNDITSFGNPPTVTGPYIDNASYVELETLQNYNPKMLPNLDSAPFGAAQAFVIVKNTVTVTIPTSLAGTYTIRLISSADVEIPPLDPNDVRVLGNPLITLWGCPQEQDPNGYPWGEFVDIRTVVRAPPIYIRADGSVDPSTAPISSTDNVTYAFTGNIHDPIEVERSNIIIDAKGHTVQGTGASDSEGISLPNVNNVTIKGANIKGYYFGVKLDSSSGNSISGNNITNNSYGISLWASSHNNSISGNNITNNLIYGILLDSSGNNVFGNNFINNTQQASVISGCANSWNRGYPSGGNYWSDYADVDLFQGPSQNQTGSDNIWDDPYVMDANNIDTYPFTKKQGLQPVITGVYKTPTMPGYDEEVLVTAIIIDDKAVDTALLSYTQDMIWHSVSMNRFDDTFNAVIPAQPYGTMVEYEILANDTDGTWIVSGFYSYIVGDSIVPEVGLSQIPDYPLPGQKVKVYVNVTEPTDASGVKNPVFFSYRVDNGQWVNTTMIFNSGLGLYETTIPDYEKHDLVEYFVKALDNAGNVNATKMHSYEVLAGDISHDGIVDVKDLFMIAKAFGSTVGQPAYNPEADMNKDGIVDSQDLKVVNKQYGKGPW